MPQTRYYYNPESCKFEKTGFPFWGIVSYLLGLISFSLLLAFTGLFLFNKYYESPLEQALRKENQDLSKYYVLLNEDVNRSRKQIEKLKDIDGLLYERMFEAKPLLVNGVSKRSNLDTKQELILGSFSDFKSFFSKTMSNAKKHSNESQNRTAFLVNYWLKDENRVDILFTPSIQPIENGELTKLVSGFGMRINPYHKGKYFHEGIDFAAPRGSEVKATANGKVSLLKKSNLQAGYGNYLEIDHGNGYVTRYAHLEDIHVKQGQAVKKGQVIGGVGMSGGAIAPHLHYEVIFKGKNINPVQYLLEDLTESEYELLKFLAGRENQALD